ncbi:hypothetical protein AAG570_001178 [Ranatra chinensis]|uniref:Chitin-binding type-2 domain-containing protein n=1 Tax=Ranatra chinensis TaxID=642074 RepID=A0ABD0YPY1_9HEMI
MRESHLQEATEREESASESEKEGWSRWGGRLVKASSEKEKSVQIRVSRTKNTSDPPIHSQEGAVTQHQKAVAGYTPTEGGCVHGRNIGDGRRVWRVSLVEGVELICPRGETSGLMTTPLTECSQYYKCRHDGSILHSACPQGTIFDPTTQPKSLLLFVKEGIFLLNFASGLVFILEKPRVCKTTGTCYELVCAGRVDGEYRDITHDCKRYYRCSGGVVAAVGACPLAAKHNGTSCVPESSTTCQKREGALAAAPVLVKTADVCLDKQDGRYPTGDDCREYYSCRGHKLEARFVCPPEKTFDGRGCSSNNETRCPGLCFAKRNGYLADPSTGCREYVKCSEGRVEGRLKCTAGTRFDGESCAPEPVAGCSEASDSCEVLGDGRHPVGCRGYLECLGGRPKGGLLCPEGLIWDGAEGCRRGACLHAGPSPRCPHPGGPTFLPDRADKCKSFYYCSRQGTLSRFSCPEGHAFDGRRCVPQERFSCPPPEIDSCPGKPDGYHVDTESGCRTYYYCRSGDKIIYYSCPGGSLYNGEECKDADEYECPYPGGPCASLPDGYHGTLSLHCAGGRHVTPPISRRTQPPSSEACPDGFHQDLDSGCKKYFFCINGVKTVLSCRPGEVYNGDLCVSERIYVCPSSDLHNTTDVNLIYV